MVHCFLEGVRVLDLSQYVPGPYAALILADLGAAVVKVEPPGGEPMRALPPRDRDGVSAHYKVMNGGKRVVDLDLKTAAGKLAFDALLAAADVMVESYRPGVLDRLGYTRARLEALNPRLVHVALSGWGQSGPYRGKAGHDINYMSLGGGLAASGTAAAPVFAWPPTADFASGIQAATSALAALLARSRSGKGAFIDVSLAESVLAWQALGLTSAARGKEPPARGRNRINGGAACYNLYRTKDGAFVSLGNLEAKFWANFCTAVGRPEWIARQWEALPQSALIADVGELFASEPLAHWERVLQAVDNCFEPVRGFAELAAHPQIAARRLVRAREGAEPLVEVLYPAWVDGAPPGPRTPVEFAELSEVVAAWQRAVRAE
ncbi:MAG TPA: CoA transferase [Alphaproteobacteria bacterium]|nr:CoA transferase [Alphaproteobacteria bacterium]